MTKDEIIQLARIVQSGKGSLEEKLRLLKALKEEMEKLSTKLQQIQK